MSYKIQCYRTSDLKIYNHICYYWNSFNLWILGDFKKFNGICLLKTQRWKSREFLWDFREFKNKSQSKSSKNSLKSNYFNLLVEYTLYIYLLYIKRITFWNKIFLLILVNSIFNKRLMGNKFGMIWLRLFCPKIFRSS